MSVINKAAIKFSSTETSRDIILERQFSPFKQDGRQLLLFIFPTGIATPSLVTTTGCFPYKERINDRRQTARAVASETELPDTSASSMARASGAVNKSLIVLSKVVYTP